VAITNNSQTLDALKTATYSFNLPQELIATEAASPRESAKLLVFNRKTKKITHTIFSEIQNYIPKECAIIFNDTKVIKARLFGKKESGGKIELLINRQLNAHDVSVYIRGKVKKETELFFDKNISAVVIKLLEDGSREVNFYHDKTLIRFEELLPVLEEIGHIPLPPYIQRNDENHDTVDYQTVFAKYEGAVAAPTASLHFSDALFKEVQSNHDNAFVTLHVGAGTFKPVESENILDHPMHSEYYNISAEALEIINSDKALLTVGTTSTRTVEYFIRNQNLTSGEANLFLHPNNLPIRVNHLLTNFHLPQSTLLMLVASFVGVEQTLALYQEAIEKNYRFYSYGDAMLII
jgi:S-adenosylmethionine:tRNA ribosyltransferase-isomerase